MKGHALALFIGLLVYPASAMAYIDPASGSAISAAIIGFIVAVAMAVKTYWYKLKSIFIKQDSGAVEQIADAKKDE